MNTDTLKHLRGLLERATAGPWEIKPTQKGKLVREERNAYGEASSYRSYIRKGEPGTQGFAIVCDLDFGYGRKTQEFDAALIVALHNAAPALLACAEALQAGHDMVESSVAHVSHGGPTREDAENWLKQAQAALDQLRKVTL